MAEQAQEQGFQGFVLDLSSRTRSLEGRYNLLRDRVLVINNNMIVEYKKVLSEIRLVNGEIKDIKTELFKIKETLKHLIADLERTARKEDVKVLEKYIKLWNPMNFVPETDVKRMIQEALSEQKKEHVNGKPEQRIH